MLDFGSFADFVTRPHRPVTLSQICQAPKTEGQGMNSVEDVDFFRYGLGPGPTKCVYKAWQVLFFRHTVTIDLFCYRLMHLYR